MSLVVFLLPTENVEFVSSLEVDFVSKVSLVSLLCVVDLSELDSILFISVVMIDSVLIASSLVVLN
jgi:hypothetical protein